MMILNSSLHGTVYEESLGLFVRWLDYHNETAIPNWTLEHDSFVIQCWTVSRKDLVIQLWPNGRGFTIFNEGKYITDDNYKHKTNEQSK